MVLAQESTPSEAVQLTELRKDLKRAREDGESQNRVIGELKSKVAQIEEQLEAVTATNLELEKAKAALVRIACLCVGSRYIAHWFLHVHDAKLRRTQRPIHCILGLLRSSNSKASKKRIGRSLHSRMN